MKQWFIKYQVRRKIRAFVYAGISCLLWLFVAPYGFTWFFYLFAFTQKTSLTWNASKFVCDLICLFLIPFIFCIFYSLFNLPPVFLRDDIIHKIRKIFPKSKFESTQDNIIWKINTKTFTISPSLYCEEIYSKKYVKTELSDQATRMLINQIPDYKYL